MNALRTGVNTTINGAIAGLDDRGNRKIGASGACQASMAMMAACLGGMETDNCPAIETVFDGGELSLSIGYKRRFAPNVNMSLGVARGNGDTSGGASVALGW